VISLIQQKMGFKFLKSKQSSIKPIQSLFLAKLSISLLTIGI